jgi:hypothetical protein
MNVRIVVKFRGGSGLVWRRSAYIEDCPVCCRPIVFTLQTDGQEWMLDVHGENE